ncbi:unnamed protein product, partial [Staurois parvus]
MCRVTPHNMSCRDKRGDTGRRGGSEKTGSNSLFYTWWRINPLGSTVSITSMLYCQGQIDNSWGPRVIGDHGAPVSLPQTQKSL